MLDACPTRAIVVLLAVATIIVGCSDRVIPGFSKVELHRSATQTLIVNNLTDSTIHIASSDAGTSSIAIMSGNDWTTDFIVVTRADRDNSRNIIAGSEQNFIESIDSIRYFGLMGEDWVITAGPPGESWEHALFLGQCWFTGPAEARSHRLEVSTLPVKGLPIEICP